MTLKESISKTIKEFGKAIITEPRFVNILADYDAFAESRQMRMVVKEMIEQGFTKRLVSFDPATTDARDKINSFVYEALNLFPFREDVVTDFISATLHSIADMGNKSGVKTVDSKGCVNAVEETPREFFEFSEDGKTLVEASYNLKGKVIIPAGIEIIDDCSFLENDCITEVVFPEGVKRIGTNVFESCTKLRSIHLPESLEIIDDSAFVGNECLTEVVIPKRVKKLGSASFAECTELRNIQLPESLEEIGSECFANCSKLTNIVIPKNVQTIGHGLSYGEAIVDPCNNYIKSVEGAILSKDGKVLYSVPGNRKDYTVPEGVVNLPMETFRSAKILESVSLPKSLLFIKYGVFADCKNLHRIEIQEGLDTIGPRAFSGCLCLEELVIPESVRFVGNQLFDDSGLKKITFKSLDPENIVWFHLLHDDYDWGHLPNQPFFYVFHQVLEKYRKLDHFKNVTLVPISEGKKVYNVSCHLC